MKKTLLFIAVICCAAVISNAQSSNLKIKFNAVACTGSNPLAGATAVYLYAGCATSSPSGYWEHFAGNTSGGGLGEMINEGPDQWSICINPHSYFNLLSSATIYNITMFFRDFNGFSGGNYTGNCPAGGGYAEIDWVSNNWVVANGSYSVTLDTCSNPVGINMPGSMDKFFTSIPNPMSTYTDFSFHLGSSKQVALKIYDILGKEVETVLDAKHPAGDYTIRWKGTNAYGSSLPSGCYFASLMEDGRMVETKKLVISRQEK